ncbi:DUF4442 domain-containing protein [Snodgrassella sp. CFCC 13594]|uniref:DUF4442 domain-containing protein n=1 Tax=Snodgrassella sp. CFCC 13594 TaxID=1775559 RepID=UPI00082F6945|nr:DUF4442 domain-containing protein [Snodgrassella sp. CFCC 13594]
MRIENKMAKQLKQLHRFPAAWQIPLQTWLMSRFVPFIKTTGLRFEHISTEEVHVSIRNQRKVQNHIHGIHACVMALLAETATGFVTNMNTPDDKLILLKSMHIDYVRRSVGNMRALARIDEGQACLMQQTERGHLVVPCQVFDESDEEPIIVTMTWAWLPKKTTSESNPPAST